MKKDSHPAILKTLDNFSSVKVYILIAASFFLWFGKISDHLWVETVLIVAGFRAATDITAIVKANDNDKGG